MKVYTKVVMDSLTGETLHEESYEYEGPVAELKSPAQIQHQIAAQAPGIIKGDQQPNAGPGSSRQMPGGVTPGGFRMLGPPQKGPMPPTTFNAGPGVRPQPGANVQPQSKFGQNVMAWRASQAQPQLGQPKAGGPAGRAPGENQAMFQKRIDNWNMSQDRLKQVGITGPVNQASQQQIDAFSQKFGHAPSGWMSPLERQQAAMGAPGVGAGKGMQSPTAAGSAKSTPAPKLRAMGSLGGGPKAM